MLYNLRIKAKSWLSLLLLIVTGAAIFWTVPRSKSDKTRVSAAQASLPKVDSAESAKASPVPPDAIATRGVALEDSNFPHFKKRPLPVARRSAIHEWTEGDGRDPQFVEKIAHNPDEFIRLMEENDRIIQRQLVYRNETALAVIERSKVAGEPVRSLVLPGLDGKEYQFEITRSDLSTSGQSGNLAGHLAGDPTSMVTLAFKFGREAFTILSPEEDTYLQGDPREPGEIIVASFDPDNYQPVPGGEPIKTSEQFKPFE
ncbi:MAG: hypothetical protein V4819_24000 [Verrucomicrobiota bacterium]